MIRSIGIKGFTIAEVVVTAIVLGIIALIGVIQIRSLSSDQTLKNGFNDTRGFFVLARSYAQTGHLCCTEQLPNGYGVVITVPGTTAQLYADLDASNNYTSGTDEVISTLILPSDLIFLECVANGTHTTSGTCDLFFSGSNVSALYSNITGVTTAVSGAYTLSLFHTVAAQERVLTVNNFGVIE